MSHLQKLFKTYRTINRPKQWHRCLSTTNAKRQTFAPLTQFSDDERMMKETVAKLAKECIAPFVRDMEKEGRIRQSVVDMLFENGLMGIELSPEYGGSDCNFMTTVLAVEEISKVDSSVTPLVGIQNSIVINLFKKIGSKEQKDKYLPMLAKNMISSFCLSETSSGSDAFAMKTTAKKDGSDYIINGSKQWISNADLAGVFLVMVNANPSAGYRGITCFIVDRTMKGVTVGKSENKLGLIASGTCPITFDNVRVPESNIIGGLGQGYKHTANLLNESRVGVAAQLVGLAQGAFDATIPYTLERKQFNQPIFNFQGMQHQISQIATQIECARLLTYNAARLVEAGQSVLKQAAMAKYLAAEVAVQTSVKCIDWMGGVGFTKDFPQEKFYRDCKAGSIYEGTHNVQLNTIAKHILQEYK